MANCVYLHDSFITKFDFMNCADPGTCTTYVPINFEYFNVQYYVLTV